MNYKTSVVFSRYKLFIIRSFVTCILLGTFYLKYSTQPHMLTATTLQREEKTTKLLKSAVPDIDTRNKINNLKSEDIQSVRLSGRFTGYTINNELEVSEPQICRLFLNALKQAVFHGFVTRGRTSNILLILKEKTSKPSTRIGFAFTAQKGFPLECYGLPFAHALDALGDYQALKLHQIIAQKRETINHAEILSTAYTGSQSIDDPKEVRNLLEDLTNADSSIYAYSYPGIELHCNLYQKDGVKIPLHFVLHSYTDDTPGIQAKVPSVFRKTYDTFIKNYNMNQK